MPLPKTSSAILTTWPALGLRHLLSALALGALWLAGPAMAHTGAGPAEAAEEQFVANLANSPQALGSLLSDDFIYLTTAGSVIGKAALLSHLHSGKTRVLKAWREPTHAVVRHDMVVSSGVLKVQVLQGGAELVIHSRYLHVWALAGAPGTWQLVARQATTLPAAGP